MTGEAPTTRYPLRLSLLEFDVLWEHLRLNQMPLVIKVPSPGKTDDERKQYVWEAWAGLESKGLGRQGEVDMELEGLLALLAHADRELDARLWVGRSLRVLAAARGQSPAMAVLTDDQLELQPVSAEGMPRAVHNMLPQRPAGPGHSVTLPSADLETAAKQSGNTPEGLERALRGLGVRQDDARTLAEMIKGAEQHGQFGAAARDRWGKRQRMERVVAFFDTPDGRYLQQQRSNHGGASWSTISPADTRLMVHQIEQLLAEATSNATGS